jgi:hypothetical protein
MPGGIRARALEALERRRRVWVLDRHLSLVGTYEDTGEAKRAVLEVREGAE